MNVAAFFFFFFVIAAVLAAGGILLSRSVFKSALLLLATLISIAGLYVLLAAEFIAVAQILIYAGGVMVLLIFGIMLTSSLAGKPLVVTHVNTFYGVALGLLVLVILSKAILSEPFSPSERMTSPIVQDIGKKLMTEFSLPFELSGILLLAALVGAAVLTSYLKEKRS